MLRDTNMTSRSTRFRPLAAAAAAAAACALLAPATALAQDPPDGPSSPPPLPEPAEAQPAPSPTCRLGDHEGFDEADARTAGRLVCAEIVHAGAAAGTHYRVALGKLGSVTILSVAREGETPGSTADSREMRLQNIEEVMVAAPRIAEAIVKGLPLSETEKVDNLVSSEARQPKSKPGKTHFALGLVGMLPPLDQGLSPAAGLNLDVHYETGSQQFEVGGSMRIGGGNGGPNNPAICNFFFIFGLGGRWYSSDTDVSPYLGGGLSWSYLNLSLPGQSAYQGDGNGLGAYVDAGVQILRTHHAHLAFGARLDLPFYSLKDQNYYYPGISTQGAPPAPPSSIYYAPLSLEIRLTF
jgi:hypothetical protein